MTQPRLAVSRPSGRIYRWPAEPPYELEVPSSTNILGIIDKPAIPRWAAREVADYAVRNRRKWERLSYGDAVRLLKGVPWEKRDAKGGLGDAVHMAIESHLGGLVEVDLPAEAEAYFRAASSFLLDFRPTISLTEATVFSRQYGYAGTFDLLAHYPENEHFGEGWRVTDWKTSKGVYPETALQLVSYARADFIAGDDGKTEVPLPPGLKGLVVHLKPDGTYAAHPCELTHADWRGFLAARELHHWRESRSERSLGKPAIPLREAA